MLQSSTIRNMGGIIKKGYRTKYKKEYSSWNHMFNRVHKNKDIIIDEKFLDFEYFIKWVNSNMYTLENEKVNMYTIDGNYTEESIIFIPKKLLNCIQNHETPVKGYSLTKGRYNTKIYDCISKTSKSIYTSSKQECISIYKYYKVENSNKLLEYYKSKIPEIYYTKVKKIINDDNYVIIKGDYLSMRKKKIYTNRVGESYQTEYGSEIEIIEYNGVNDITVRITNMMNDGEILSYTKKTYYHMFSNKRIRSNLDYDISDIACIGIPSKNQNYVPLNNNYIYERYKNLCAFIASNEEYKLDESFDSFYKFKEWYDSNNYRIYNERVVLSKYKGNIYGKDTCLFVPLKIANVLMRNAKFRLSSRGYQITITKGTKRETLGSYKTKEEAIRIYESAKEKYIKELIMKYRQALSQDAYEKLLNYKLKDNIKLLKNIV